MTVRTSRTFAAAVAIAVLGLLALSGASPGAAVTGTFGPAQWPVTGPFDYSATCLGPGATGTFTGTETLVLRFTRTARRPSASTSMERPRLPAGPISRTAGTH
jgi:hypothetical protein